MCSRIRVRFAMSVLREYNADNMVYIQVSALKIRRSRVAYEWCFTNQYPSLVTVLNFSPSISGMGGTSTPLNIVGWGLSSTLSSLDGGVISPGISAAPNLCSGASAITTEAKRVKRRETGRRRMLMRLCCSGIRRRWRCGEIAVRGNPRQSQIEKKAQLS